MRFLAASVPRSVRAARLGHLRTDAILGHWHIANAGGGFLVFDVIMQAEADFLRTKNHLAAPTMDIAQLGKPNPPYVLKDTKQFDVSDGEANPAEIAAAYFRQEFKLVKV